MKFTKTEKALLRSLAFLEAQEKRSDMDRRGLCGAHKLPQWVYSLPMGFIGIPTVCAFGKLKSKAMDSLVSRGLAAHVTEYDYALTYEGRKHPAYQALVKEWEEELSK